VQTPTADPASSILLSPLRVGSLELRNRVVFTAHGAFLSFYRPGESADRYVAYQERRAAGGAGLIILQPVQVHPSSQSPGHYVYEPDDLRAKLRRMSDALHAHGTGVLLQLMHFGAEFRSDANTDLTPLWSFGGTVSPSGSEASHAMTAAEIDEVADAFVDTAVIAIESGLDGVELHAAHGYLLQQSFSPWANTRADEWGRPERFMTTILERMRARVGAQPVVGVRISLDDFRSPEAGGLGPAGLRAAARTLVDTGHVDYVNTSAGSRSAHYSRAVASYEHPPGELLPLAAQLRSELGGRVPVVGVGRVTTPELAERALRDGTCDLVAMTRAQIADPDVVAKFAAGEADRIRPCVGANQGCVDRMVGGLPITCFHNPDVGREHRLDDAAAADAQRVLVVGGGPAGLAAALAAARRGHEVTLVERGERLGGRLRLVELCGAAGQLMEAVRHAERELERLGVTVELGTEADADLIARRAPGIVVVAAGARPAPDKLPAGDGSVPVIGLDAALQEGVGGRRVLVVDHIGAEEVVLGAERLGADAAELTFVTPMPSVGAFIGFTRISAQLKRLYRLGPPPRTMTLLTDIRDGAAVLRHIHSGAVDAVPADLVVAGVHGRPDLSLKDAARAAGARVLVAGDAVAPRDAMRAFREGDDAGRAA
jgi:2,4-dienoyl-CoA reductase-like NADH-dependent reductase (Old Yellow Enzyme family)